MNIDFSEQCYECLFREQNALSYASCSCVTADSSSLFLNTSANSLLTHTTLKMFFQV